MSTLKEQLIGGVSSTMRYLSWLSANVYRSLEINIKSEDEYIDDIIELMEDDSISDTDFVKEYDRCVKEGKLKHDLPACDRLFINRLDEFENDASFDGYAKGFRSRRTQFYQTNPGAFRGQFYKSNQNTTRMFNDFKNWVRTLDQYQDIAIFNFEPLSITTAPRDSSLNKLIKEKYGVILERGIDAIAVSASGRVFCIEAKYIGTNGSHQTNQIKTAIDLAKTHNESFSGLAVIDGDPVVSSGEYKLLDDSFYEVDGRITSSYQLLTYLNEN